ncbi:hypothetical protein [Tenacibaculum amylolyticum]|uniref:hypothetical protein n=1 Tax=Tenacibaculum amylolyticum TaxID=104269 RepID=UPI003894144A
MILKRKYDIVISFTEAQKEIAMNISLALELLDMVPFYYPYKEEESLGKNLIENLKNIYQNEGVVVVAIFSEEYFLKKYTLIEFKEIQKRLLNEPDCLIPVLYGEVELPTSLKGLTHICWEKTDPKSIASIIKERIEEKIDLLFDKSFSKIKKASKGELIDTIKRLNKFKKINKENIHFYLGICYYHLDQSNYNLQKSIENFTQVVTINPTFHKGFYWLSRITIEQKGINRIKYKEILQPIDWLKRAIELAPEETTYVLFAKFLNEKFFNKHGLRKPF